MGPLGDVRLTDLSAAAKVAEGGQGTVFRLARPKGTLLKLYHGGVAVLAAELGRLIELPARDAVATRTAWPSGRVFDRGRCVGLLMPEAPDRFTAPVAGRRRLLELQYLLYPRRAMWAELPLPTEEERRRLAAGYLELFRVLHGNDVVVGDVSMRNLLWTLAGGPGVFAIDCDGFRLADRPAAVRPADTAGWVDPGVPARGHARHRPVQARAADAAVAARQPPGDPGGGVRETVAAWAARARAVPALCPCGGAGHQTSGGVLARCAVVSRTPPRRFPLRALSGNGKRVSGNGPPAHSWCSADEFVEE